MVARLRLLVNSYHFLVASTTVGTLKRIGLGVTSRAGLLEESSNRMKVSQFLSFCGEWFVSRLSV